VSKFPASPPAPEEESPAADILFRGHAAWLRSMLRRRFEPDLAEDLVQDTYLRVIGSGRAADIRHPRAFLWRVAANLAADMGRRQSRRPSAEPMRDGVTEPGFPADQAEQLMLKQIILDLPEPLRQVFLLSRVGGLTYESIARHLNISVKTVEWRMSKALARCAERLED
jgi:RNA polymerase sigma factor (sigma-70 family)